MSNEQLKALVIERVMFTQDEGILQAVLYRLTEADSEGIELSSEQKAAVAVGLADLAAGRVVLDEDLEKSDRVEWR